MQPRPPEEEEPPRGAPQLVSVCHGGPVEVIFECTAMVLLASKLQTCSDSESEALAPNNRSTGTA